MQQSVRKVTVFLIYIPTLTPFLSLSYPLLLLSDTPLGLACGRNANVQVIMPLLSNGAHIDFRGKEGLTPLHRAALGGNSAAIKVCMYIQCTVVLFVLMFYYALMILNACAFVLVV